MKKPYFDWKLYHSIYGAKTVGELAERGCPECGRMLFAEASIGFGSLHCRDHGVVWQWMPTHREKQGYAPKAWKNYFTKEKSKDWIRRERNSWRG